MSSALTGFRELCEQFTSIETDLRPEIPVTVGIFRVSKETRRRVEQYTEGNVGTRLARFGRLLLSLPPRAQYILRSMCVIHEPFVRELKNNISLVRALLTLFEDPHFVHLLKRNSQAYFKFLDSDDGAETTIETVLLELPRKIGYESQ